MNKFLEHFFIVAFWIVLVVTALLVMSGCTTTPDGKIHIELEMDTDSKIKVSHDKVYIEKTIVKW